MGFLNKRKVSSTTVPHYKTTQDCVTEPLLDPKTVTILLAQHIGAPASACVQKGDTVYVGSLIGRANGFVSANIHSSVSGTVTGFVDVLNPLGAYVQAVVIESDGRFMPDPAIAPPAVTDAKSLVSAIAQSGLVGLGGAGFPTHVKLSIPEGATVDTLIVNAAECEPYITSDYREMVETPERVVNGVCAVRDLLGISKAIIAIEANKPAAIETLTRLCADKNIEVVALPSTYPQGAEKVLITNVTGRVVPAGKLPSDAGCLVLNTATAAFIDEYLRTGMPLVAKRLTVDGGAVTRGCNLLVPIGTPVADVIAAAGGYNGDCEKLLMGGPMMGTALASDAFPVLKNNNAILALTKAQTAAIRNNPCIRCGRCVDACPMHLSPAEIQTMHEQRDPRAMQALGVLNCIECGSCTFVCPAKRSVTQIMRLAKGEIRKAGSKK